MPGYYPWREYYPLLEMLLCSFNAILFILLSFLCLRDFRGRRTQWGGYIYPCILIVFAVLFLTHLGSLFVIGLLARRTIFLDVPEIASNYFIAPLVVHLFYRSEKEGLAFGGAWRASVIGFYLVSLLLGALAVNSSTGWWRQGWPLWQATGIAFGILMLATASWCSLLLWVSRRSTRSPLAAHSVRRLALRVPGWTSLAL